MNFDQNLTFYEIFVFGLCYVTIACFLLRIVTIFIKIFYRENNLYTLLMHSLSDILWHR